ncbi:MAG: DUF423 domain-containing protein [Candidatus Sericytochromatia bacterium]|nr:DUF423 domain-containing protein [Candidatus Sericytochromatia bacterium]
MSLPAFSRRLLLLATLAGGSAITLGAFGAHLLKDRLPADLLLIFETAVRYQMYHALVLLSLGLWFKSSPQRSLRWAAYLIGLGMLIFSGSLYLLVWTGVRVWGAVTPVGGLCLLAGWGALALAAIKSAPESV